MTARSENARFPLDANRAERKLADKKPLFSTAEAVAEAERCLYCADAPCTTACPTDIDVPTFIKKIASGNVEGSAKTIFEQNILGYSCARVCPVEVLCQGSCVYETWGRTPIAIGRLQRYAVETTLEKAGARAFGTPKPASGKKVALVGAGPASIACAAYLALEGHTAEIFEKRAVPGGLNATGIAPYKLHADDALWEIGLVESLGVTIKTGVEIGKDIPADKLLADYDAVYLGIGLGADSTLGIDGEDGPGVQGAVEWIEAMKLQPAGELAIGSVIVIGGGNTAIDAAREAAQLGAKDVRMVYRRGERDMSGYAHEMAGARQDGVRLLEHRVPVRIERDSAGKVQGLVCAMAEGGRAKAGTEHTLPCDHVLVAIGQAKMTRLAKAFDVKVDARGRIEADPSNGQTSNPKVYSGGDCINGGKEVVNAVADGRNTARHLSAMWSR